MKIELSKAERTMIVAALQAYGQEQLAQRIAQRTRVDELAERVTDWQPSPNYPGYEQRINGDGHIETRAIQYFSTIAQKQ